MTLTFELIRDINLVHPLTNFCGPAPNRSSVRALTNRRTDAHTHRTDFIPSTAYAEGKKCPPRMPQKLIAI